MRRSRSPLILLAIAAFVALVASLPAQQVLVEKRRFDLASIWGSASDESVLGGEDLDRDGHDDLLVFEPGQGTATLAGGVGLYSGFSVQRIAWLDGVVPGGAFGRHLAWVDDVDGDGRRDVAISRAGSWMFGFAAPEVEVRSSASGRLLSTLSAPAHFGVVAGTAGPFLDAVEGMGDLDGDGAGDVLVKYSYPHRVVLHSGRTGQVLREIRVPSAGPIAAGRDLDLDGVADFVLGCWNPAASAASVQAYSTATGALLWTRMLPADHSLAHDLGWMDDLDGDGRPELLAGLPWILDLYRAQRPGMVAILRGSDGGTHATATGARYGFGTQVKVVGDVDGDAFSDFLVLAPYEDRTWLYSGATREVVGSLPYSPVLAAAGDLDGDGLADFVIRHGYRYSVWGLTDFALRRPQGSFGYHPEFKFDVVGATPSAAVAVLASDSSGTSAVTTGTCAGTPLPLADPQLLLVAPSDAQGGARFAVPGPSLPYGMRVFAVDVATCRLTNLSYSF